MARIRRSEVTLSAGSSRRSLGNIGDDVASQISSLQQSVTDLQKAVDGLQTEVADAFASLGSQVAWDADNAPIKSALNDIDTATRNLASYSEGESSR
jgi:peptidoglycan hydrolase CwlO-like protein